MSGRPTLLAQAYRLVRDERLFSRGELVLCACSGGPDSSALLHVLALLRRRVGHELVAAGVDHGLRPEAAQELDAARAVARSVGVELHVLEVELGAGSNLQARAREARHRALQELAGAVGATVVALGHTADDRAETLLLRLLRGAGPRGLGVLPARSAAPIRGREGQAVELVRPLLTARRSDVLAHLQRHGVAVATDPSNADPRFLRSRVRHELLPLLAELSPHVVEHLCCLADALCRAREPDDPLALLGRAQRRTLERAQRLGRTHVKLRMRGAADVEAWLGGGPPVLEPAAQDMPGAKRHARPGPSRR